MTTRYRCHSCGNPKLERLFYVWRREDLDDPEAFDLAGAEPAETGDDWYCAVCAVEGRDPHPAAIAYDDTPVSDDIVVVIPRDLAMYLKDLPLTAHEDLSNGRLTPEFCSVIDKWVRIRQRIRMELRQEVKS